MSDVEQFERDFVAEALKLTECCRSFQAMLFAANDVSEAVALTRDAAEWHQSLAAKANEISRRVGVGAALLQRIKEDYVEGRIVPVAVPTSATQIDAASDATPPVAAVVARSPRQILNAWFFAHVACPYPSDAEKSELAEQTGLTVEKVSTWMANKRMRVKSSAAKLKRLSCVGTDVE